MDDASLLSLPSLALAAAAALCCLCAMWALHAGPTRLRPRPKKKRPTAGATTKSCGCACSCGESGGATADADAVSGEEEAAERLAGGSMMEQLVPEVRLHALSYLDYPSMCRLSMTNSWMRTVANDNNAWKALYRKDFTVEQDSVTPINGWKSYYAATKAIIKVNAEFYNIIRERSLPAMSHFWLHADYVKCIHSTGELFTGFSPVMDSWALAFNWDQGGQGVPSHICDVCVRVLNDMAWVTMKAGVDVESWPYCVTNVYEFHNGQWYMVLHHRSEIDAGPDVIEA